MTPKKPLPLPKDDAKTAALSPIELSLINRLSDEASTRASATAAGAPVRTHRVFKKTTQLTHPKPG